jgi:hypothetical protein
VRQPGRRHGHADLRGRTPKPGGEEPLELPAGREPCERADDRQLRDRHGHPHDRRRAGDHPRLPGHPPGHRPRTAEPEQDDGQRPGREHRQKDQAEPVRGPREEGDQLVEDVPPREPVEAGIDDSIPPAVEQGRRHREAERRGRDQHHRIPEVESCAENGCKDPVDIDPFLPWNLAEAKRREFALDPEDTS